MLENMRYNCGRKLALRDKGNVKADMVAGFLIREQLTQSDIRTLREYL